MFFSTSNAKFYSCSLCQFMQLSTYPLCTLHIACCLIQIPHKLFFLFIFLSAHSNIHHLRSQANCLFNFGRGMGSIVCIILGNAVDRKQHRPAEPHILLTACARKRHLLSARNVNAHIILYSF